LGSGWDGRHIACCLQRVFVVDYNVGPRGAA